MRFTAAARAALEEMPEKWGTKHGAIVRLRCYAWEEYTPFLDHDVDTHTVICSTDLIVALVVVFRAAVRVGDGSLAA